MYVDRRWGDEFEDWVTDTPDRFDGLEIETEELLIDGDREPHGVSGAGRPHRNTTGSSRPDRRSRRIRPSTSRSTRRIS